MAYPQYDPASQAPPPWPPQAPVQRATGSRLLPILGVVLGLLGLIAGLSAWFRPLPSTHSKEPAYSEQQVSDARRAVCDAFGKGVRSIAAAVSKKPDDSTETFSSTLLNARIAESAVASFLFHALDMNPAAPTELQGQVRELAELYQGIVITQLADGSREDVKPMSDRAIEMEPKIKQQCQ